MERYNMFNQVHKGLRSLLYETALLLQQTDFLQPEESEIAIEQVEEVVVLFEKHAHTEDSIVFPSLQEYEPSVVDAFEEEHDKDHELGERLKELLFVISHSQTNEAKIQAAQSLSIAFVEFLVFNLNHMAKEEEILNKLFWRYYTDDQLYGITQKIVSQVPPEQLMKFSRRMMRGLNNPEIIQWLKETKKKAPPFVFDGLTTIAEKELHDHRWIQVRDEVISNETAVI